MTVFAKVKADQSVTTDQGANTGGAGGKPLLGSANTVYKANTGGAGAKPLLGSAHTVWCWVWLG